MLSREVIAEAALELFDAAGTDGLTMSRLAKKLGVSASSLYNHIASKDDLISLVRERVSDRIDASGFAELDWPDAVRAWAHSYREAFVAHPPTIALLATMPLGSAARTLGMYEHVVAGFERAGWQQEDIMVAMVALESFILGSALDALAPDDMFDPGALASQFPHFTAALDARTAALDGRRPSDLSFELGLEALIAGFSGRYG